MFLWLFCLFVYLCVLLFFLLEFSENCFSYERMVQTDVFWSYFGSLKASVLLEFLIV